MAGISTFESLKVRDYRLLWLGQVSTSMGQWMDQVTRGWLMYELTGSAADLGFVTAARGLPRAVITKGGRNRDTSSKSRGNR